METAEASIASPIAGAQAPIEAADRVQAALATFDALPRRERWFVRARLRTAPLEAVAKRAPAGGRIADIGCGHGLLTALLAAGTSQRTVIGVDPDERKIDRARQGPGQLDNVSFRTGTAADLHPEFAQAFDAVAVADVLYLLPSEEWPTFLEQCRRLLKPGGRLLLKEAEADGSWKHLKCVLQENLMVRVLRKTRSSGGLRFRSRSSMEELLVASGFRILESASLSRGYTTPHVLFVAEPTS